MGSTFHTKRWPKRKKRPRDDDIDRDEAMLRQMYMQVHLSYKSCTETIEHGFAVMQRERSPGVELYEIRQRQ